VNALSVKTPVYLDYNATTPVDPRVLERMLPYFSDIFGNAASDHEHGHEAHQTVEEARSQIASILGARPDEIIFTSGATESNNLAIFGVAQRYQTKGQHIITSMIEHPAVLDVYKRLEALGWEATYLPVDSYGLVDPDDLRKSIRPDTILVSIMTANNEIGTIQNIREIGKITREHGVFFHTDAAQAFGSIDLHVEELNIDLLSISGHKIYGPKGIGALYVRRSRPAVLLQPVIYGGGHERGLRSGTINVPAVVGLAEAGKLAKDEREQWLEHFVTLRQKFLELLMASVDGIEINGHPEQRLAHNINFYIEGVEARSLLVRLKDVSFSTGSACTSAKVEPSHVIKALGFQEERAHGSIRISFGRQTTEADIKYAATRLANEINYLRRLVY